MATSDDAVINSISASMLDLEKSMNRLAARSEVMAAKMDKSLKTIGTSAKTAGTQVAQGMNTAGGAAQNLTYQLNDIGMMMASGQSPFMLMMQQGSQVAQIMGTMQSQGVSLGATLKGAFAGLLNPLGLMSMALIGGTAAAVQFFGSMSEGAARSAEDILATQKAVQGLIKDLNLPAEVKTRLNNVFDAAKLKTDIVEIETAIKDLRSDIDGAFSSSTAAADALKLGRNLRALGDDGAEAREGLLDAMKGVDDAMKTGGDVVGAFTKLLTELDAISTAYGSNAAVAEMIGKVRYAVVQLEPGLVKLVQHQKDLQAAQDNLAGSVRALSGDFTHLKSILGGLESAWGAMTARLGDAAPGFAQRWQNAYDTVTKAASSATALIKDQEGFRPDAYWDVNAWRTGFGSDTYVDEMGKVQKVTRDTVVTLEQANADLQRRIGEFQNTIMSQIGANMWASLAENQQAALTSIAYNYGSLPDAIVAAIKSGDKGQVADAIRGLSGDNGGINAERRKEEAALYGGAEAAKAQADAFDQLYASNAKQLELTRQTTAINKDANLTLDQKTIATRAAAETQKLLTAAEQQGLPITDELTAKIKEQAQAMAEAGLAADQAANKTSQLSATQKETAQALSQLEGALGSGLSTFLDDLRHGVPAGEAFKRMIDSLISELIRMTVQMLILKPLFAAISGGIGLPSAGAGAAMSGGTVGATGFPKASVSPMAFAGAPSFARGGMVGLASGAMPIIAHKGEIIIPKSALGKIGTQTRGGNGDTINNHSTTSIKIENGGGTSVTQASSIQLGQMIDRTIQGVLVRESKPGGLLRQQPGAR